MKSIAFVEALRRSAFLGSALLPFGGYTQTFQGTGAMIPDNGDVLEIPLQVSGLPSPIDTLTFGLEQVCINIQHTWISDLEVSIVAPDGTLGMLVANQGGDNDGFSNTCFSTDAPVNIVASSAPYSGLFRPQGQMGAVNNGQNGNGTWRLRVYDTYPFADEGDVLDWSIRFGDAPAVYFHFTACDLPLVVIDTNDEPIPQGEKISGTMGIIDNAPALNHPDDPFNGFDGYIGIELRGNSSLDLSPKKSYDVELRDHDGADLDSALLGMPSESDWILSANYFDKSLLNNSLTYHLAHQMGRYAPRTRPVEVLLNGVYQGVYVLTERIKQGPGRVDIARLRPEDVTGDDVSGGYIISVDRQNTDGDGFASAFQPVETGSGQEIFLRYRYPKPDAISPPQRAYIEDYVDAFESALDGDQFTHPVLGYRTFADAASFIDLLLLNEISHNVDGYRLSSYLYKDKDSNGGKLHAGPAWDYDIAWGNANYCEGSAIDGWAYDFGEVCGGDGAQVPFWWSRMLEDPQFVAELRCRWEELRVSVLSPANIDHYCDSMANVLSAAAVRNFTVWPILGTYVWPNPSPLPTTYAGEVLELKVWAAARWSWVNDNLQGTCNVTVHDQGILNTSSSVFPSPFIDHVFVRTRASGTVNVELLDALGRMVSRSTGKTVAPGLLRVEFQATTPRGNYMLRVMGDQVETLRVQH